MSKIAKIFPGFSYVVEMVGYQSGREKVWGEQIPGGVRIEQTTEHDDIEQYGEQWVIDCYTVVTRDSLEEAWEVWQRKMELIASGVRSSYNPLGNGTRNRYAETTLADMRAKAA